MLASVPSLRSLLHNCSACCNTSGQPCGTHSLCAAPTAGMMQVASQPLRSGSRSEGLVSEITSLLNLSELHAQWQSTPALKPLLDSSPPGSVGRGAPASLSKMRLCSLQRSARSSKYRTIPNAQDSWILAVATLSGQRRCKHRADLPRCRAKPSAGSRSIRLSVERCSLTLHSHHTLADPTRNHAPHLSRAAL